MIWNLFTKVYRAHVNISDYTNNVALKVAQARHTEKFDSEKSTRQTLFALGWTVDDLTIS